jgi:hypothetical protein
VLRRPLLTHRAPLLLSWHQAVMVMMMMMLMMMFIVMMVVVVLHRELCTNSDTLMASS